MGRRAIVLNTLLLLAVPVGCLAATYRWVGEDGKAYYSDNIPPLSVHRPYQRLDKHGNVEEEFGAQLTPEQQAAEQRRKEEAEAREDQTRRQQIRDRMLAETYSDLSQLAAERDQSLATADSAIEMAQAAIERQSHRRDELTNRVAGLKDGANRQTLEAELNDVARDIDVQQAALEQRRKDREAIAARYASDMARLEEIRSGGSASRHPDR